MAKDNKINLKLEVFKDKNSGKLSIIAHFDKSAPNIYKEKENFLWMPTVEEKDFLYEVFQMIPGESTITPSKVKNSKSEESKETDELSYQEKPRDKTIDEKFEKSSEISVSSEDIEDNEDIKDTKREKIQQDVDDAILEELKDDELKTLESEQDKGLIVEADSDAIDEALKKHSKNDDAIIEADEQTIIDKVLSQKKKGRWGRK